MAFAGGESFTQATVNRVRVGVCERRRKRNKENENENESDNFPFDIKRMFSGSSRFASIVGSGCNYTNAVGGQLSDGISLF